MKNSKMYQINLSPWPLMTSMSMMIMAMDFYLLMNLSTKTIMGAILTMMNLYQWTRDVARESLMKGEHNKLIQKMLKNSVILFILSEVFLFMSLFWAFISESISPDIIMGGNWPPKGINSIHPLNMPLMNTVILISSGAFITWAHHSFKKSQMKETMTSMLMTILMGIMFIMCMKAEYMESMFMISSGCYGSLFFLITGFHGSHVLIGMMLLTMSTARMNKILVSKKHMTSIEFSIWYWHFVDVVWLMVYSIIYWTSMYLK